MQIGPTGQGQVVAQIVGRLAQIIEIHYDLLESVYARWSPALNGKITVRPRDDGRAEVNRSGNDFPSFEAYQFVNGRTIRLDMDGAGLPWELVR